MFRDTFGRRITRTFCRVMGTVILVTLTAVAAPGQFTKDRSARQMIDRAILELYLRTQFKEAEHLLVGTIEACGDACRPETIARAWMYVGIVRFSGLGDEPGALEAFKTARSVEPRVKLDADLASDDARELWQAAMDAAPQPAGVDPPQPALPADESLKCTPRVLEAQTGRPLPVSCTAADEAWRVTVHYRSFGERAWRTVTMRRAGRRFEALLPCSATEYAGPLRLYIVARNAAGARVASSGSSEDPVIVSVNDDTTVVHALPGRSAPPRCARHDECPPGMRCPGERRQKLEPCRRPADCATGVCIAGQCRARAVSESARDNAFGLHFAFDVATLPSADAVCASETQRAPGADYRCFRDESAYPDPSGEPATTEAAGNVDGGVALGTLRMLVSYERALSAKVRIGARAGLASRGAPADFLPVHAEARASYWFARNPSDHLVRPVAHVSAGVAQVDASIPLTVGHRDRTTGTIGPVESRAYTSFGRFFAAAGAGVGLRASERLGLEVTVSTMLLFPTRGLAVEPSLGALWMF